MTINLNDLHPVDLASIEKLDISDLDGWKRFVGARNALTPPPTLTREQYEELPPRDRLRFDVLRRIGIYNMPKHETPMTAAVRSQVQTVLRGNAFRVDPGVRSGVFISADGAMGKSTLMREIAADFEREIKDLDQVLPGLNPRLDRWVPVAWVTVPPKLSIRALAQALLDFYGEPHRSRDTESDLTKRVGDVIRDCGTKLLVLDDITRYKGKEADQQASDWIRNLMETSVTVVALGVDVRGSGILADGTLGRSQRMRTQTARRFTVLDLHPFRYDTAEDVRDWVSLLAALEDDLPLLDKQPGMLTGELAEYLFEKTDGVIGSLTEWVASTAETILGRTPADGGELLTKADFERVPVKGHPGYTENAAAATPVRRAKAKARKGRNTAFDQPTRAGAA